LGLTKRTKGFSLVIEELSGIHVARADEEELQVVYNWLSVIQLETVRLVKLVNNLLRRLDAGCCCNSNVGWAERFRLESWAVLYAFVN